MGKLIDLTGKKFGRLTVIKRSYPNKNWKDPNWLCKCECGTEKIIGGTHLRDGHIKSCGCLAGNKAKLSSGVSSMRGLMNSYRKHAKERGHIFKLTEEEFSKLTQKECHYCGAKPNNISRFPRHNGDYIYNGLDRIDNTKGYIIDNVVSCCKKCNRAKGNLTLQEYKNWIKKSYNKIFGETR